jgi:glutathionylspermidine synthase
MRCHASTPRDGWRQKADELGFTFHSPGGEVYWDENRHYSFTLQQIEADIEAPTAELHALCLEVVARVVRSDELMRRLAIPANAWDVIARSWARHDRSLYGRFDFSYDGRGPAKLLEYNADTPTSLFEASVFQWLWLEDLKAAGQMPADADQFNSIHERLIAAFKRYELHTRIHFASVADNPEDEGTCAYLADCARTAGLVTDELAMLDIRRGRDGHFEDVAGRPIERLFKLYPWEWMFAEDFASALAGSSTRFIEPPWKAILSNKGLMVLLWELAPGHPNLLRSYFEAEPRVAALGGSYVRKPLFSREGANVTVISRNDVIEQASGLYGHEGHIRQELAPLPCFEGRHAVVGSWVVADEPAGLGVRDDAGPITRNGSRFVPHIIAG